MIRKATVEDVDALVALGEYAHAKGPFSKLFCNQISLRRTALLSTTMPNMCCFVSDKDGINGVLIGIIAPNIWGNSVATDLGVFVRDGGNGVGLVKAFIGWAKDKQAEMIAMSNTYGNARYDKLLTRLGLKSTGQQFIGVTS